MDLLNRPEVVNALAEIAGANSLDVVDELTSKDEVDEFSLSEKLGIDVKTIRKILYKLYDNNLVNFRRIKDDETGWYIYLWKFDNDKVDTMVGRIRRNKISSLREKIEYESNHQFFMCDNGCDRVPFKDAMATEFECQHCNSDMNFVDNSKIVRNLENQLKYIEKTFGL